MTSLVHSSRRFAPRASADSAAPAAPADSAAPAAPRRAAAAAAAVAAACGLAAYLALSSPTTGDYLIGAPVSADNAAPAVWALAHGHLGRFFALQPLMGLLSLVARAPVAALTAALGGGPVAVYQLGAFVLMLPTAFLAGRLAGPGPGRERAGAAGLVAAAALLISPPVLNGLRFGHPEELLAATLAAGSVLAATRGRPAVAGLLLGAAIGTKEWAAIAVLPVLIALPDAHSRRRAGLTGAGVALALLAPAPLLNPAAFARASRALGASHVVTQLSAWWPLASHAPAATAGGPPTRLLSLSKATALPLALAVAAGLALAATVSAPGRRLKADGRRVDAFALLCLLAVVRCAADTGPVEYYFVALVFPLAVWEAAVLRRLPLVTLLTVAAVWLTYERTSDLGPATTNALTLMWTAGLACYLAFRAFVVGAVSSPQPDRKPG